jgi:hypothetical protein
MDRLENLLPYGETGLSRLMYFSGAYFVAKRRVMEELPLDERLSWGEGEDVVWSHRFRERYAFSMNAGSRVQIFGKRKDPIFREVPAGKLEALKRFVAENPPGRGYACRDDMESWREHGHFGDVPAAVGGAA